MEHLKSPRPKITLSACRLVTLSLLALAAPLTAAPSAPATQPTRTKDQVDKLIEDTGKTPPDWWNAAAFNPPASLSLQWKDTPGGWYPQKNMGAYLWDIIDPNPSRWHEGVKLVQHTLTLTKDDPVAQGKAMRTLARIYTEMLQDYPRGAYWAKKTTDTELTLAECYIKLGCPSAARDILEKLGSDNTRNGQAIKLWAELGDLDTALEWADLMADLGYDKAAYLAAGDACRRFNKIPEAIKFYEKVLASPGTKGDDLRNKKRAQASLDAIKLFDTLDLNKIPDGTYKAESIGYVGPVEVIVTVKNHKIESCTVGTHHEKQFYASIDEVPPQIIQKQSIKGIDTTTGATVTSEAIINASAKALNAAQK